MKQIFFHIGYPKCASTTFQKNVFLKHPDINYIAGSQYQNWVFNYNSGNFPELKLISNKANVFSSEFILNDLKWKERMLKLKKSFPDAKIIIIIRRQTDLIRSMYYTMAGEIKLEGKEIVQSASFDNWVETHIKNYNQSFISNLEYGRIISFLQKLFGTENTGIFLFEELKKDRMMFTKKLSEFMGIDVDRTFELINRSPQNTSGLISKVRIMRRKYLPFIELHKIFNPEISLKITLQLQNLTRKIKIKKSSYRRDLQKLLLNQYLDSNIRTNELTNLKLEDYGYNE